MLAALRRNCQAVELAGKSDGKVADVNHLLHFAPPFRQDLARLDGNKSAKGLLAGAQFLAKKQELAMLGRWSHAPLQEGRMNLLDRGRRIGGAAFLHLGKCFSCDRREGGKRSARIALFAQAKACQKGMRFCCEAEPFVWIRLLCCVHGQAFFPAAHMSIR